MLALIDCYIIDMLSSSKPQIGSILIDQGQIIQIGNIKIPEGMKAKTISLKNKYILPGLIDSHTHLCMTCSQHELYHGVGALNDITVAFYAIENAKNAINHGITSVRDVGGQNYIEMHLKELIDSGKIDGPRIYSAGKVITTTGGHLWRMGVEADSEKEVIKALKEQIKSGGWLIKMIVTGGVMTKGSQPHFLQYDEKILKSAVRAAHELDKKVTGHIATEKGLKEAVKSGIDSVEHALPEKSHTLKEMLKNGIISVPTMVTYPSWLNSKDRFNAPKYFLDKKNNMDPNHKRNILEKTHQEGLKIVAGTDAGVPYVPFGNLADEIKIFSECGFSNYEAISSATSLASELIGDDKIGKIKVGCWADLMVLNDNPLDDISRIKFPKMVIKSGKII
jgi:imidazolonepropionase-like amidohydrolase